MGWKEALQIVLFVLSWVPVGFLVVGTLADVEQPYNYDFSIYNTNWNGTSNFRIDIEEAGYEVTAIETSMSIVYRYNGSAILTIMGPVRDFTFDAVLTIYDHLRMGGSVLIADDFGTANSSFFWLNQMLTTLMPGSLPEGVTGFLSYTDGVLFDLDSYGKSPIYPIIQTFSRSSTGGAITQGVNRLYLNWASTLSPTCMLGSPGVGLAWTTVRAWCETNITNAETNPYPDEDEWAGILPVAGALAVPPVEGAPREGRLVAVSDPSLFTNDMLDRGDNRRFANNIIHWLSEGYLEPLPVLFCENLLEVPIVSAEFFYGFYLARALWMTTQPLLAPIYPLITAIGIKKYLPDMKKPEVKSVSDVFLRKGQTYFSERLQYYRTEGNYARVVKMLYRKLRRDLRRKHMWSEYDSNKVWDLMRYKDSKFKQSEFFKKLDRIEAISSKPGTKIRESELMELFFFMRNISAKLIETRK
ncbi:MAG: DUF4350 domain-containing protein [Candidatus Thorarchaeota archaeon]